MRGRSCPAAPTRMSLRSSGLRGDAPHPYSPCQTAQSSSFLGALLRPGFAFSLPPPRGRGAPEARTCGSPVTLARRDAASFRTRPSRATGTAPLGAPPWRFSGRATTAACHRQVRPAPRCGFPRPGSRLRPVGSRDLPRLAVRTAPSAGLPPPRSASERLRRRPSMSEDVRNVAASRYEVNSVVAGSQNFFADMPGLFPARPWGRAERREDATFRCSRGPGATGRAFRGIKRGPRRPCRRGGPSRACRSGARVTPAR